MLEPMLSPFQERQLLMTSNEPIIQTWSDARWYLILSDDAEPSLPIDFEVERLEEKGILRGGDPGRREARRAIHEAMWFAYNGTALGVIKQKDKKMTSSYLGALQERTDKIIRLYAEIHSSFENGNIEIALHHFEEELKQRFPKRRTAKTITRFKQELDEFLSFEDRLYKLRDLLSLGNNIVVPKRGRPKAATYHFISRLALEWFRLTGAPPTRSYDAIEGKETGDFYKFCVASAETIRAILPPGRIDSSVRQVCGEWRSKGTPPDH
jgi:hypothetical protein